MRSWIGENGLEGDDWSVPNMISPPGAMLTYEQAVALLCKHEDRLLRHAREVADDLTAQGYRVYFWTVLTPAELMVTWPAELPYAPAAFVHYALSATVQFATVQLRLDKATGEISTWDHRMALGAE
jgi:hypothetical protein